MYLYIWDYVAPVSTRYHNGGGVMILASTLFMWHATGMCKKLVAIHRNPIVDRAKAAPLSVNGSRIATTFGRPLFLWD